MSYIKGRHAVKEAIHSGIPIHEILYSSGSKAHIQDILLLAQQRKIQLRALPKNNFEKMLNDRHAQHVMARARAPEMKDLKTLIDPEKYPIVVMLDHLEDPHNVGAILRTCEGFGIKAVVYPKDRACDMTPGVMKASAGAVYHLDLCRTVNLGQATQLFKDAGYWIYGADSGQGQDLTTLECQFPALLILGNEHKGLSKRLSKMIHLGLNIPMEGKVDSFNVSVSAGILMYAIKSQLK